MRTSSKRLAEAMEKQPGTQTHILRPCFEIYNLSHLENDEALKGNNGQGSQETFQFEKTWVRNGLQVLGKRLARAGSAGKANTGWSRYPITDSVMQHLTAGGAG
jgi:hypothetical protein